MGLLQGNRGLIARNPYLQDFSVISHTCKAVKNRSKLGASRVF